MQQIKRYRGVVIIDMSSIRRTSAEIKGVIFDSNVPFQSSGVQKENGTSYFITLSNSLTFHLYKLI